MAFGDSPLARLLRRRRLSAGLTQQELAQHSGLNVRTVRDVERGPRGRIDRDTAQRLADAMGLGAWQRAEFQAVARGKGFPVRSDPTDLATQRPPTGIAVPPTRLIGRERELETVLSALRSPEVRLITLSGPGGIGKTRLAIEAADQASVDFKDGAFFISLAAVRDATLVAANVAHAIGLRDPLLPLQEALADHLRGRQTLLALDNFEHLLDAAGLVADLVASCPALTVLVTSRAALHVRGEHEIAVAPLDLPGTAGHIGDLSAYSAVALFMERARAVKPDLRLDDRTAPLVGEICRRLDGLPLALELAAARVKHFPLQALRDELEHRLRLLTRGHRDLAARHQAMRNTIAWSYELLEPSEQRLFRQLSIFAGGWTLDCSEFVCADADRRRDVLADTSALVDQSLISLMSDADPAPRYSMLDVIREYAAERRDASGETKALARRHGEYFLRLAEQAESELGGWGHSAWFRRLDVENENLRAALSWSIDHDDAEFAVRLSGALWQFWRRRGDVNEGRSWLEAALNLQTPGNAALRHKALWGVAWLAYHQGDFERSHCVGSELLTSARSEGDRLGERNALTVAGKVCTAQGRYAEAIALFEDALVICRELGATRPLALSLFNLGTAYLLAGRHTRGEALTEESLTRFREIGDDHFSARTGGYLAYPALLRGDVQRAESLIATSLGTSLELGDTWGIAEGLARLSAVHAAGGNAIRAARLGGAAEALRQTIGMQSMPEEEAMLAPHLIAARDAVDGTEWEAAWNDGRSMSLVETVDEATRDIPLDGLGERLPAPLKQPPRPNRVTKTFMFTDMVGSTQLVEALGDEAWGGLLRWHNDLLQSLFTAHGGQQIDAIGDGFFVGFDSPRDALLCAVAIQRRLAEHRRAHGFAPQVRIGVHAAEVTEVGGHFRGKGVHEAARIGALAGPVEILVSEGTAARAGFRTSEPRRVTLKGITEPVNVVTIQWR